jgi:hypothetical protein
MNVFNAYSLTAFADAFHHQQNSKADCSYSGMLSSPTFNTLKDGSDVDNSNFGACCKALTNTPTCPLRDLDQFCDELALTDDVFKGGSLNGLCDSSKNKICREISFNDTSDLFCVRQQRAQAKTTTKDSKHEV